MTSRHNPPATRLAHRLRHAFAALAALGLLGAAAQANAIVRLERAALEARVEAMRAALNEADPAEAPTGLVAQWNNFKNWNNWNNWKKWLNQ
ncbi:MAG: hypothetical protein H7Y61_09545 [Rhizobiales bacterium]|nr:hypothetical protein [Rhizobacter sp.]